MKWVFLIAVVFVDSSFIKMGLTGKSIVFENPPLSFQKTEETIKVVEVEQQKTVVTLSVLDMIRETFPEEPEIMLAIAKAESSLNPHASSITDKMADGRSFSYGLYQINLTVSVVAGVDCSKAFIGRDYSAVVTNEKLFAECIELATNVEHNLETARAKYDTKRSLAHWGAYLSGVYKNYL